MFARTFASGVAIAAWAACQPTQATSEPPARPPTVPAPAPAPPAAPPKPDVGTQLTPDQDQRLQAWFAAIEARGTDESFGELVARAAGVQLDQPYVDRPHTGDAEALSVDLATFQCVSFVESTLAVARCTWSATQSAACFLDELEKLRYRGGKLDGYASRLHYFHDWLGDNGDRKLVRAIGNQLGAKRVRRPIHYMSRHPARFPPLKDPQVRATIVATEKRLSAGPADVVAKATLRSRQHRLQDGDIVAIVGTKPGLLITHAGFIQRGPDGSPRLLHASSHHGLVLLTSYDISTYLKRRPERLGIMAARPVEP